MRILLSGLSGTGSSSAAKCIAEDLRLNYIYGGAMFRQMAKQRGVSLEDQADELERNPEREREIDAMLLEWARKDGVLIESRTVGWILPRDVPAIRIWLTCDLQERLRRVEGREHHARSRDNLLRREESDNRRYLKLYGIRPDDFSPFDLVLDTTYLPVDDVVQRIEEFVAQHPLGRAEATASVSLAEVPATN